MKTPKAGSPRVTNAERFAALVDIENVAILAGNFLAASQVEVLLGFVDARVTGMQVRVASGENVMAGCMGPLCNRGWGRTLVDTTPDAADRALIETACGLIGQGVSDLVVVSGDGAFVELASHARLHVISHPGKLSTALRLVASSVTYLPDPALAAAAA